MRRPSEQEERKRSRSWRGNNFVHRFDWPRRRKARPRCPVTTIFAAREIDSYYATISRLLRTNLLPSGEGGREVVYSPGNASIDRPYLAPATKLIENERALSLSLSPGSTCSTTTPLLLIEHDFSSEEMLHDAARRFHEIGQRTTRRREGRRRGERRKEGERG